jgi:Ni,Fe-hydrogenase III component G
MMREEEIIAGIKEEIGIDLIGYEIQRKRRVFMEIRRNDNRRVTQYLKDRYDVHISTISGVDGEDDFVMVYHFDINGVNLNVKARIPKNRPRIKTISDIIPGANWAERETMEMFGLVVEDHPDPRRLLLPDDWDFSKEGHPLSKY